MNKHPFTGFTLPELMLVMAIAGIISLGGFQGWQRWQQQQQLRDSARQLQGFLLRARAYANWHNREVNLWLMPGKPGCLGAGKAPDMRCQSPSRWVYTPPYPGVRIQSLIGEPGFYGRRDVARPGSIDIESEAGRWRVIISSRARIRLCRPEDKKCT